MSENHVRIQFPIKKLYKSIFIEKLLIIFHFNSLKLNYHVIRKE